MFQHHQAADLERHLAVRDPAAEQLVRAAAHVDQIAVRGRALAAAERAKPGVVEVSHGLAEEIFIKPEQLRTVDHAVDGGVFLREVAAEAQGLAGTAHAVDDGKRGIQRALGREPVRHRGAGREDQVAVEKPGDEKIAVLLEPLVQRLGLAEVVGGRAQLAERLGGGVELVLVGKQGRRGDHRERG